jgi:death-on-curing protein
VSGTPRFLSVDNILRIHQDQIENYGGSTGVRDLTLVESAAGAPSASFGGQFLHADLFEMAAALLFALVQNHAFIDGNKRVGTAAALVFLKINGIEVENREPEFSDLVLRVAMGKARRNQVSEYLRKRAKSKP